MLANTTWANIHFWLLVVSIIGISIFLLVAKTRNPDPIEEKRKAYNDLKKDIQNKPWASEDGK